MSTRPKKELDRYELHVENQNWIPNKQNPERIEITVSTEVEIDGETHEIEVTPPAFEPNQVATGSWEKHACRYVDKKIAEIRGEGKHEVPDLEGETVENSGYDFTGPGDKDRYPEGPDV